MGGDGMTCEIRTIFCVCLSLYLYYRFFVWIHATNECEENRAASDRFIARLAAYPSCSMILLLSLVLKDVVPEGFEDAVVLGSVLLCKCVVFFINRFLAPNAVDNKFTDYIHGFILALAVIFWYYEGWQKALPLFLYFLGFYIDFDFKKQEERKGKKTSKQEQVFPRMVHCLKTIWGEYGPALINCLVVIFLFIIFPAIDQFIRQNYIALGLPWVVLTAYYVVAVITGKYRIKRRLRNRKTKQTKDQN